MLDLSIIIVNYNARDFLLKSLKSLFQNQIMESLEVFLVDNASTDGSVEEVRNHYPQVKLITNNQNKGFAAANNQAIKEARGRYLMLLNSDAAVGKAALKSMLKFMDSHSEAGAVGPRLIYPDGTPQPSVDFFPNLLTEFFHLFRMKRILPTTMLRRKVSYVAGPFLGRTVRTYLQTYEDGTNPRQVDCISGACLLVRREVIDKIGLLDENFFMYMEDMDWCIRMKRVGFKIYYLPNVEVLHYVGESGRGDERAFVEHYRSRLYFFTKHRGRLAQLFLKIMMAVSFGLRWAVTRQNMYLQVLKILRTEAIPPP